MIVRPAACCAVEPFSSLKVILQILSRLGTRWNWAPFRAGDVTRIPPATGGHLLSPAPYTCTAIGLPRGRLASLQGDCTSLPRSVVLIIVKYLGPTCTPVEQHSRKPLVHKT